MFWGFEVLGGLGAWGVGGFGALEFELRAEGRVPSNPLNETWY